MRIVMTQRLSMGHGIRGGMETQAHILGEGLIARGHDLTVLTNPHPDNVAEAYEGNIPVRYIGPGSYRRYYPEWADACYAELARLHRETPVDVLLSQCDGSLGYFPRAIVDLRLPTVVIIHGSITGEIRTRWRNSRSLRGLYRLVRHLKRQPQFALLWRKAAPMIDRWIVVSAETARIWQREMGLPSERLQVIVNGVDTTRFRPDPQARQSVRTRLDIPATAPVLIAVGRLEEEKGFHLTIQALGKLLPQFPDMRLLIAGEGVYDARLRTMARSMGDRVHFLGYVPNHSIAELLAASDIFVMSTLRDEGLPINILEALATSVPVVASRIGGIPSAVDDGRTGVLLPPGDVAALVAAIARLLTNDAERLALGQAGRQAAQERFSQEHMVTAIERVLDDVVQARHARRMVE